MRAIIWMTDSIPTHLVNGTTLLDTSGEVEFTTKDGQIFMTFKKYKTKPYKILKITKAPEIECSSKDDCVKITMKAARFHDEEIDVSLLINNDN